MTLLIYMLSMCADGLLLFAQPTNLTPRLNPASGNIAYLNGNWYETAGDSSYYVSGNRYSIAGVFTAQPPSHIDTTIDLGGNYIVPPFGEAHNHSIDGPWTVSTARTYLSEGIFYYKNPNNVASIAEMGKSIFNQPDALDVVFAHGGLSIDEGHPERLYRNLAENYRLNPDSLDGKAFFDIPSVAVLEKRWSEILAGKPDFIKLYLLNTKKEGTEDTQGLSPEVVARAVELAHESGLSTTVHVESASDLEVAVKAGVDEAAHLPGRSFSYELGADAYRISDALATKLAEQQMTVVTTTRVTAIKYGDDPQIKAVQNLQKENLRKLYEAGVPLAIGTDIYQETAQKEIFYLYELQIFSNEVLLQLWIETAPISIFPYRAIGKLSPGYEANFIVLGCDPKENFACVKNIVMLIKQGEVLEINP